VALDEIGPHNGAMQVAPGTQKLGERLPVAFGSGLPFMTEARPDIPAVPENPLAFGHEAVTYILQPGQGGVHDGLVWHGSVANATDSPRYAFVLRYVAEGTLWLGERRMAYDETGCPPGSPLTREYFPLARGLSVRTR